MHDPNPEPVTPKPESLRRNVELKARLDSLEVSRSIAAAMATDQLGTALQLDTYFHCAQGRLKLREADDRPGELIWYTRPDHTNRRTSQFFLQEIPHPQPVKELLSAALGVRAVVKKTREIYLIHNVRVHLDRVDQLGCFLEFEAVMEPGQNLQEGHDQLAQLQEVFHITPQQTIAGSYGEMVLASKQGWASKQE